MGWFSKRKRTAPTPVKKDDIWVKCHACTAHVYREEWLSNLKVCPKCNFHDRISFQERLGLIIDDGSFHEFDKDLKAPDPLKFVDAKGRYADKTRQTTEKTGLNESVITGRGKIHGMRVVLAIMDFRFLGGSLGSGTGEKILSAARFALKHKMPYIVISASGGARMHEGILSLMQMAKTCAGIAQLHEAGLPYISVLTHPTTGGVSASFAMVGDVNIAEPKAMIGFAGRRVIEQTIKEELPDDFQTAEYLLEHGFIDHIVQRTEMKDCLYRILQYWSSK